MKTLLIPFAFRIASRLAPRPTARVALGLFLKPRRRVRPEKEARIWNLGREQVFASGSKGRIFGESGPVLLFVHGWEGRASQFHRFVEPALERGFRVILWDGPAHGDSPGKEASAVLFARHLARDLGEGSIRPRALIGHSMGGSCFAMLSRFGGTFEKAVTISSPTRIRGVFERYFDLIRLGQESRREVIRLMERRSGLTPETASWTSVRLGRNQSVLMIHDESDKEIPFQDFELIRSEKISEPFRFVATRGLGHRRILLDDGVIRNILDFVQEP